MPFVAVTFATEAEGPERTQRVVVGRRWRNKLVLAIDATTGGAAIVLEGGDVQVIAAGAISHFEPGPKPMVAKKPEPKQRKRPGALPPPMPRGSIRSVRYHDALGARTVTVGDLLAGSRRVVSISQGNRVVAMLDDGSTHELCGAGSVYKWEIA